ncbi:MAG TPA: glucose-6-phosphate isomerase [Aestuariivirgaceae bacterium]|nr:glucose-6-phosphate isomerase [Aestuariivirgaceae bacterium]
MAKQARPTVTGVVADLRAHRKRTGDVAIRELFSAEPERFARFSAASDGMLLDWSKCAVDAEAMRLLHRLADAAGWAARRDAMFEGGIVNDTEQRAALHVALRNLSGRPISVDGRDVMPDVKAVLARMSAFGEALRDGTLKGAKGEPFTDVVNIGIGGSDLGPAMATRALSPYHDGPSLHFVSNVDGAHIADTLRDLNPGTTLVIVASKTFTTVETMTNAATARAWIAERLGESAVADHFAAISTALDRIKAFGIPEDRTFGFWDWVGGRYSLWSAIGLPILIAVGTANFERLLAGGHAMDEHFRTAPPEANLPLVLGLLGLWHRDVCGYPARAIIPYEQRLERLPAYFQQLDMESNGKRVTRDGKPVALATGPVVWGEPGTNGQHAFFQLLHQGTDVVPVEFMVGARGHETELRHHHDLLVANCLAQSEALMRGRTLEEARAQLMAMGRSAKDVERLAPHRVFPGDRPSITLAYGILDPHTLGRIVALYEHRVFVEATVWDTNPFDQWGVELGKEMATNLLPLVQGRAARQADNSSTEGLLSFLDQHRSTDRP